MQRERRRLTPKPRNRPARADASVDTDAAIHVASFRSALRAFLRTSEELARANGLTPQRHLLLLMIKGSPSGTECATVGELAERLQLAQSTVTELVKRAESAGLITRRRSDVDARIAELRLTREGERRLASIFHGHSAERHELRRMLAELELAELVADPLTVASTARGGVRRRRRRGGATAAGPA